MKTTMNGIRKTVFLPSLTLRVRTNSIPGPAQPGPIPFMRRQALNCPM